MYIYYHVLELLWLCGWRDTLHQCRYTLPVPLDYSLDVQKRWLVLTNLWRIGAATPWTVPSANICETQLPQERPNSALFAWLLCTRNAFMTLCVNLSQSSQVHSGSWVMRHVWNCCFFTRGLHLIKPPGKQLARTLSELLWRLYINIYIYISFLLFKSYGYALPFNTLVTGIVWPYLLG